MQAGDPGILKKFYHKKNIFTRLIKKTAIAGGFMLK